MFHTMNFARKVAGVAATLLLLGCQTYTPEQLAELMDLGSRPVSCTTIDDCSAKWSKAIGWILTHSANAIQTQSDSLVTTYVYQNYHSGYALQKVAEGNGAYRIDLKVLCNSAPRLDFDGLHVSCIPTEIEARAHFYNAVMVQ